MSLPSRRESTYQAALAVVAGLSSPTTFLAQRLLPHLLLLQGQGAPHAGPPIDLDPQRFLAREARARAPRPVVQLKMTWSSARLLPSQQQ